MFNLKHITVITIASAGIISSQADTLTNATPNSLATTNQYPWVSEAAAGVSISRGNSDLELFNAKIGTKKKTPVNEYILGADGSYGKSDGVENADSIHGNAQYNRNFNDKFYGFVIGDALHDGIQDIKYRLSLNPGAGYYFIKSNATTFSGEVGPGVVTQKLGDDQSTYADVRVAERFDQVLTPVAKMWEKAELLTQVSKLENYYVNAEIGVETAMSKTMSLQLTLDDSYVNQPAAGRKSNDVRLIGGISYKF